jgi:hypothetical protein
LEARSRKFQIGAPTRPPPKLSNVTPLKCIGNLLAAIAAQCSLTIKAVLGYPLVQHVLVAVAAAANPHPLDNLNEKL